MAKPMTRLPDTAWPISIYDISREAIMSFKGLVINFLIMNHLQRLQYESPLNSMKFSVNRITPEPDTLSGYKECKHILKGAY